MTVVGRVDGLEASVIDSIIGIDAAEWDDCNPGGNPLVEHRHIVILEASAGSASASGSSPHHLVLRDGSGRVVGVAPCYLKTDSHHELGWDLGLPLAHARAVGPYYPKLQVEVPRLPSLGPRLMVRRGEDGARVRAALLTGLRREAERLEASSVQIAFMTDEDHAAATAAGFACGADNTFFWRSRGEAGFDDFVAAMRAKSRYNLRKDRESVAALGLEFEWLTGSSIDPGLVPRFLDFYLATYKRYGARPTLDRAYFESLFREMPGAIELLVAKRGGEWVAGLLSLASPSIVCVQHWGQSENNQRLLFEMFYLQIERNIEVGRPEADFGFRGLHKVYRGIEMVPAPYALWFRSAPFQAIAEGSCARRRQAAATERTGANAKLPFADRRATVELAR